VNITPSLKRVVWVVLAVVMGAGLGARARAQSVLIDFGSDDSFRGATVLNPDQNGNFWNSIAPGVPLIDAIDSKNGATAIDLYFDTPVGTDSFNGPAGVTSLPATVEEIAATDVDEAALGVLGVKAAVFDFAASPGGADNRTRFQIQQLDPTKRYTLTLFGSHKFSTDDTTVYSVYSDSTYSTVVGTANLDVQEPGLPHLHNRETVATIGNLAPQEGNILYVEFVGAGGNLGYLNAFELAVAREPGDADLNGTIDIRDYFFIDRGRALRLSGWDNGDFTGDGVIDAEDFAVIDRAFLARQAAVGGPGAARAAVPEPGSLTVVGMAACALRRTRGRRLARPKIA
jgi:hypothetical protein